MKIIDINDPKDQLIIFEPLFSYGEYLYTVKMDHSSDKLILGTDKKLCFYDGFYKYNFLTKTLEHIHTSECISNYFYSHDQSKIYYETCERCEKNYYMTLFSIDLYTEKETKIITVETPIVGETNIFDVTGIIDPFELTEDYIAYLLDEVHDSDDRYSRFYKDNEYKLFIYDINKKKSYQLLNKKFCEHGFKEMIKFEINNKEYILLNSALYIEQDKHEYVFEYKRDNKITSSKRGEIDGLYLIEVDIFINEVKEGKSNFSYKEIESIDEKGTVRFIKRFGTKIYYKVDYFEKEFFEIVIYDINTEKYTRKKINDYYSLHKITNNGEFIYLYDKKNRQRIELRGEDWENRRELDTKERILGVLESTYLIVDEFIDKKRFCSIYDLNSLNLVDKYIGTGKVFEEENMIVIY
ncbi:hypothetical protein [Oceanirhabdus sp. W0125-5]|uniref:hypothetical protein n=1 Tax=Oceanirhabdus sp. W0125-5 TaxID=2999116 RepID=UPI0022F2FB26|nr:hypothetical protein [Oceanirhabdus sp. W0125-5]WBW97424.1 hypothetical protein OW730_00790 [Oceanirhabdus sp. W0125-5]